MSNPIFLAGIAAVALSAIVAYFCIWILKFTKKNANK